MNLEQGGSLQGKHLDKEWLRQKYEVEGLSTYEIGRLVERDPKRIYSKLRDFGIPTRKRGLNLSKHGKDNYCLSDNPPAFLGKRHTEETKALLSEIAKKPKPHLRGRANGMYGMTGEKNPRWVDGSSPYRQKTYAQSFWKEIIRTVYQRDGYRCQKCGSPKTKERPLHAHHIIPWAGNEESRFELTNLVTLRKPCHQWVHSNRNIKKLYLESSISR